MMFTFPSLLYRSALLQREIDAEQTRALPDRLRIMRLKALRLKVMERLHALNRYAGFTGFHPRGAIGAF